MDFFKIICHVGLRSSNFPRYIFTSQQLTNSKPPGEAAS